MNRPLILFLNVLVIATCGLVYELLAGTIASYLLGDSVTQFSLVIGLYLAALGLGAWLSRYLISNLAGRFVELQLLVALAGGASAPVLFLSFAHLRFFNLALYTVVMGIGTLVGLEIPLLLRILKDKLEFKDLVSKILAFDYAGSVIASLLFPLLLVPRLGLVRTSLLFGLCNAGVGFWATILLRPLIQGSVAGLRLRALLVAVVLAAGLFKADWLTSLSEDNLYVDEIVYTKNTPYQRIVVTRGRAGFNLFLNNHLQFSSADEYRYHEALVQPALALLENPRNVLVLGGGDGLALREILLHPEVQQVTLVDLDPAMTGLSEHFRPLAGLNHNSFQDPRVKVVNEDAMKWLEHPGGPYDAVIVDFPDPNSFALGKLYTTRFYRLLKQALAPAGCVAVQCTSPLFARTSYWCIIRTMEAAGLFVQPYQATVPSFGVWGFGLARKAPFAPPLHLPHSYRFLNDEALATMFVFSADMAPLPVEINRLDNQALVHYYEEDWKRWE
jgi:spermidine synthase